MPLIKYPITLSATSSVIVEQKKTSPGYSHTSWGDNELLPVRREIREHYRNAQRLTCAYCLGPISSYSTFGAQIEHIAPKSQYLDFMFEPQNMCVVCPDCNEFKSNREALVKPVLTANRVNYPKNSALFRIVHPHFDSYEEHIAKFNRLYVECSDKGGYTIYICNLNRFYRKFGRCEELVEDVNLAEQSERFFENGIAPEHP
ncbi:hypothetical protein [Pseudomonas sp. 8 R 14]|nr:HNH endonuclease domain-containing protein [Pseudomonas sp. 8 R 14]CRM26678.1 hypothetical protein [Pseudomonas sp. 8 R 14]